MTEPIPEAARKTPISDAFKDRLAVAFTPFTAMARQHPGLARSEPFSGSLRAGDITRSAKVGREPWFIALDQVANALDTLLTWRQVVFIGNMLPTFAHITLIRGSMEASVTTRWLMDPRLDQDERLARAAGWLQADYIERGKVERRMTAAQLAKFDRPGSTLMSATRRIEQLDGWLSDDGLEAVKEWGYVDKFRQYGDPLGDVAERHYRLLCAYAHSRRWRLLSGAMRPLVYSGDGSPIQAVEANEELAVGLTDDAVRLLGFALAELRAYGLVGAGAIQTGDAKAQSDLG